MAIVTNSTQEEEQVLKELKEKIKVEVFLGRKLSKFFDKIVKDQKEELGLKKNITKQVNIETEYAAELQGILQESYSKATQAAINVFDDDKLLRQLIDIQELENIKAQAIQQTAGFVNQRSHEMSAEILSTTKKNLQESEVFVNKLITENELTLTNAEKNSLIMDNFENRLNNRIEGISQTETQVVYENAKHTQGNLVARKLDRAGQNMQKDWNAFLDGKTREFHAMAHGQRKPLNTPFEVGGERLMYPGDTSLGASLWNIIRCRCTQIFVLMQ